MNVSLEQGRITSLSSHFNNLASYGGLYDGYFITVGCIILENRINYIIISSYYINYIIVILIPYIGKVWWEKFGKFCMFYAIRQTKTIQINTYNY